MNHELKILPKYYVDCENETKTFELRKNDRNYKLNDVLILKEWNGEKYTGRSSSFSITYILKDVVEYGLKKGFLIIGIKKIK